MNRPPPSVISQPTVKLLPEQPAADPSYPTGAAADALAAFLAEIIARAKAAAEEAAQAGQEQAA